MIITMINRNNKYIYKEKPIRQFAFEFYSFLFSDSDFNIYSSPKYSN